MPQEIHQQGLQLLLTIHREELVRNDNRTVPLSVPPPPIADIPAELIQLQPVGMHNEAQIQIIIINQEPEHILTEHINVHHHEAIPVRRIVRDHNLRVAVVIQTEPEQVHRVRVVLLHGRTQDHHQVLIPDQVVLHPEEVLPMEHLRVHHPIVQVLHHDPHIVGHQVQAIADQAAGHHIRHPGLLALQVIRDHRVQAVPDLQVHRVHLVAVVADDKLRIT